MDPAANTAASFQSTIWSLVLGARADRAHLEHLLRAYWSPVYAFIRRQGYAGHDASDLTQEFLTQVVLGRDLIGRADPARGRFRSFLKQALRNFLIDQHRLNKAHKGGGAYRPAGKMPATFSLDDRATPHDGPERPVGAPNPDPEADHVFDREWAATVIELALNRLEESCLTDGMDAHWTAFTVNVLGPTLRRTAPMPLAELAKLVGATDDTQASNMLQTVKRRFRRVLHDTVAETVGNPAEVAAELADLKAHFGV